MIYPLFSVLLGAYLCSPMSTGHSSSIDVENLNSTEEDNSTSCMLADDCDFYAWLIDDGNYGIPGFEKEVVEGILKKKSCEENENGEVLKVNCPIEGLDADDGNGTRTVTATAKLEECQKADAIGEIRVTHGNIEDLAQLSAFTLPTQKKPKQVDFPNLARGQPILKTNTIIHYEATGICFCWEFYDKPRFQGGKQLIWPGDRMKPENKAKSVKRIKCPDDDEYDY